MDSLTHIVLGAVIGEAYAGKALGKKAMVIGALAQSLPDIDFVMSFWLSPVDSLLAHRGFTHSILFGAVASLLIAIVASRWIKSDGMTKVRWIVFIGVEAVIHLFLDAFNSYGIGWFEPFSHQRISFNVLFVADPFYSVWLGIGFLVLLFLKNDSVARKQVTRWSLVISSLYLVYALFHKFELKNAVEQSLLQKEIKYSRFFTTPTPFNNWLWYIVAETDSGYQIGYHSVFDRDYAIRFTYFPRKAYQLDRDKNQEVEKLLRFSQGYYTVETRGDSLVFNDLRFGQITGWNDPQAKFAFHYYLNFPEANLFVIQRGRFANWNRYTIRSMLRRIGGAKG